MVHVRVLDEEPHSCSLWTVADERRGSAARDGDRLAGDRSFARGAGAARGARPDEHEHQHRYLAYLDRNDAVALVAEVSGCVVGFVNMEFRMRLHFRSEQAWIPDLVVAPGYRGAGIGAALLAEAERLAWERGCWGMALDSAHWRIDAHRFYTTQGWADTGRSLTKSLSDQPWPPPPPAPQRS